MHMSSPQFWVTDRLVLPEASQARFYMSANRKDSAEPLLIAFVITSRQAHDVNTTSPQRRCNVHDVNTTSPQRRCNVLTLHRR